MTKPTTQNYHLYWLDLAEKVLSVRLLGTCCHATEKGYADIRTYVLKEAE